MNPLFTSLYDHDVRAVGFLEDFLEAEDDAAARAVFVAYTQAEGATVNEKAAAVAAIISELEERSRVVATETTRLLVRGGIKLSPRFGVHAMEKAEEYGRRAADLAHAAARLRALLADWFTRAGFADASTWSHSVRKVPTFPGPGYVVEIG